ncbi:glycosyltransferase [Vibrio sp. S4M6]|nr:glycosyltransferase [Vibrio sinus]MCL9783269.1 glycosyltransferase [Vibrio sinus]
MILIAESPLILLMIIGIFRWHWKNKTTDLPHTPSISFIITCYGEGNAIRSTIDTLVEQHYPGHIEVLAVVDGAVQNQHTYQAAMKAYHDYKHRKDRVVKVIPKWQRGGRVSTLNTGLLKARHELVINVDGDTSFDNNMALVMAQQFRDKNVIASGGALRVRNARKNILTRMQALEYMMSMQGGKTGTTQFGLLNNISGAFGAFRKKVLQRAGGWDTHTAEDLDLTMRLKQYKGRYRSTKLAFTPHAIGHTDAPETVKDFILQRLRWDGDLMFLYVRKHIKGLSPKLLGWPVFLYTLIYGVLKNVILPIIVIWYLIHIVVSYPTVLAVTAAVLIYSVYLLVVLLKFTIYWVLISERKANDIKLSGWLFLYPIYALFSRFITAFSIFNEVIRRSHEESSMAPWWVLKRGKKF